MTPQLYLRLSCQMLLHLTPSCVPPERPSPGFAISVSAIPQKCLHVLQRSAAPTPPCQTSPTGSANLLPMPENPSQTGPPGKNI